MTQATAKKRISNKTIIKEWQEFYLEYFGLSIDLSKVKIPRLRKSYDRVIIIAKDLTCNQTLEAMRKLFDAWTSYDNDDLYKAISSNSRDSKSSYAIRVRNSVEPDEEFLGKSADEADPEGKIGVTLLERLILELKYFSETGEHLDTDGWTLCTGSRLVSGRVPGVCWLPDYRGLGVGSYSSGYSYARGGLRSAVSFPF